MRKFDFNIKEKMCLGWMIVGLIAIIVGIFIKVPSLETVSLKLSIQNSSATIMSAALLSAGNIMALSVLKYIIVAAGAIIFAFSSILFAGAINEREMFEDLMFDDDFEGCGGCSEDCMCSPEECENCINEEETVCEIAEDENVEE